MRKSNRRAGNFSVFYPPSDGDVVDTSMGLLTVLNRGGYWQVRDSQDKPVDDLVSVQSMTELCYKLNLLEPSIAILNRANKNYEISSE